MRKPAIVISCLVLVVLVSSLASAQAGSSSVRGVVTNAADRPVGSVWILVLRDSKEAARAVTADDGRYYIGRLSPGSYTLQVKRGGSVLYQAQVTLPKDAVHNIRVR